MESSNAETIFLKVLKRLLLVVIGSGLLSNALYIYGLGYYQGYIERIGFDYNLFPVEWSETLLWTYTASRELGISSLTLINEFNAPAIFTVILGFYFIARIWMETSHKQGSKKKKTVINFKQARKLHSFHSEHIFAYRLLYVPLRWFFLKEQSFIAFGASYFFMIFLFFIPIFLFIWIYFPWFGLKHGEYVAETKLEHYKTFLCGDSDKYWSRCLEVKTGENHLIVGRVILSNNKYLAILTSNGPVTVSPPKNYFFKTKSNPCFEDKCEQKTD